MVAMQPRIGSERETHGYFSARSFPEDTSAIQFPARMHVVQEGTHIMAHRGLRWRDADDAQAARFADAYRLLHVPESVWLADTLAALADIDDEIAEENLPAINAATKAEAERLIRALAQQFSAPTVYPTQDGEIAIHFKSPRRPDSVVILLNNGGQGECYAYTDGRSRRAHYDVSADLPDGFLEEQLRALAPARVDISAQAKGIGLPDVMFVADLWKAP